VGQRKQLLMLLLIFAGVGLFLGLAIWQISQLQQKDRDLARVKSELDQTKQQIKLLQDNNKATIVARGKLQKDLVAAKKQLTTFQQQGLAIEQQLKAAQALNSKLVTENSTLLVRLSDREKQLASLQQSLRTIPGSGTGTRPAPNSAATTTPNFLRP
jgi:chromosome segregation ATPase